LVYFNTNVIRVFIGVIGVVIGVFRRFSRPIGLFSDFLKCAKISTIVTPAEEISCTNLTASMLFVLELEVSTGQTDKQTDERTRPVM